MMTMHILWPVAQAPALHHTWMQQGRQLRCVTPRGEPRCACGAYLLCDPLAGPCREGCGCQCHQAEGVYE